MLAQSGGFPPTTMGREGEKKDRSMRARWEFPRPLTKMLGREDEEKQAGYADLPPEN